MTSKLAPPRWSEVTALYGGTFDPPHLGHRMAVAGLFSEPGIARVRVILSPSPPHKPTVATTDDRTAMVRLGFGVNIKYPLTDSVTVDLCELERARLNPSRPTYTFDTLSELKQKIPHLAFVIGTDQLAKLNTWHRFPEVLGLSHWIILERRGDAPAAASLAEYEASGLITRTNLGGATGIHSLVKNGGTWLRVVQTPAPEISSTQIRESLARSGKPPEGSLLPEVEAYLMRRGIYGTRTSSESALREEKQ